MNERPVARALVALSLSASLAALGCTTNRTPGNGDPVTGGPTAPAATSGTSSGTTTPTPPPMTSSYQGSEVLPPSSRTLPLSPAEAAAVMAQHETPQPRVLGPADPGPGGRAYVSDGRTNQFSFPALATNPQLTVNSSISSYPVAAITSGAGGAGGGAAIVGGLVVDNGGTAGTVGSTGTIAGTTGVDTNLTGTSTQQPQAIDLSGDVVNAGGPIFTSTSIPVTAASAGLPPLTALSSRNPTVTQASAPLTRVGGTAALAATVVNRPSSTAIATTTTTTTRANSVNNTNTNGNTTATANNTARARATATIGSPVRILNVNGRVVVTNTNANNNNQ
ncbi:MAG TPA: hypothetical protein VHL59_16850 [Thermoanaerobaculia bacterium]|nr:hypothetical protein [Thermoanaerobaculia bacterium]